MIEFVSHLLMYVEFNQDLGWVYVYIYMYIILQNLKLPQQKQIVFVVGHVVFLKLNS